MLLVIYPHLFCFLQGVDENEFIDACRLVYDGVREVRRAVLLNREDVFISNRGHYKSKS